MSQFRVKERSGDRDGIWEYFVWNEPVKPFECIRSAKDRLQLEKKKN